MTKINLLPWREQRREQEKKRFLVSFFVIIVLSICIVFLINLYDSGLVSNQIVRNQMLQNEIAVLDNQLNEMKRLEKTRELFISRMLIVQQLQTTRAFMVHVFDELINVMPSGIYLTKMEVKNDALFVTGYTASNFYVSILMKNVANNGWFHSPVLSEINKENKEDAGKNEFKLNFVLVPQIQHRVTQ